MFITDISIYQASLFSGFQFVVHDKEKTLFIFQISVAALHWKRLQSIRTLKMHLTPSFSETPTLFESN